MDWVGWFCNATLVEPLIHDTGSAGDKHDGFVAFLAQEEHAVGSLVRQDALFLCAVKQMPQVRCAASEVPMSHRLRRRR